jgi:hypothetical protein
MALQGKDYCNCDHAHILREAIESALCALAAGSNYGATLTLKNALAEDAEACNDLWAEMHTEPLAPIFDDNVSGGE